MSAHSSPPDPPEGTPAAKASPGDPKADRLAEALRANLKRRKAADRARQARKQGTPGPDEDA